MTPTEYRRELGRRLKRERVYAGFTLEQVETRGIITKSTLSRVENGGGEIRFEKLLRLAALYDVSLERLLEELVPLDEPLGHAGVPQHSSTTPGGVGTFAA